MITGGPDARAPVFSSSLPARQQTRAKHSTEKKAKAKRRVQEMELRAGPWPCTRIGRIAGVMSSATGSYKDVIVQPVVVVQPK